MFTIAAHYRVVNHEHNTSLVILQGFSAGMLAGPPVALICVCHLEHPEHPFSASELRFFFSLRGQTAQ